MAALLHLLLNLPSAVSKMRMMPCLLLVMAACVAANRLSAEEQAPAAIGFSQTDVIRLGDHDRPILVYRCVESPMKPYVEQLFSPSGVQVLRDSPKDHKHHHGLMFAVAVEGVDFWGETAGCGHQRDRGVEMPHFAEHDGLRYTVIRQRLDWLGKDTEHPLATERRTIETYLPGDLPCTLLTWQSQLEAAENRAAVELTGHHYYGLGMRFVESMDKGGRFFNSENAEGESIRGSERLTAAKWCAYSASADGKPVTVAVFDHPKNLRYPARMFTMTAPFAYLGVTLNLWKEPLQLERGQPLLVRYGVAVWDGKTTSSQVEAVYQRWLSLTSNDDKATRKS